MSNSNSNSNSVKDRLEACRIGQELLSCGLILCVTYGFPDDYDEEELVGFNEDTLMEKFSDLPSFIYKFPERGSTNSLVGKYTLFGETLVVSIPQWARSEEGSSSDTGGGGGRESQTFSVRQSEILNISGSGSLGHIEYLVVASHLDEEWQVFKRFREFEQLHKHLGREGISGVNLPQKGFGSRSNSQIDVRRKDLELYLQLICDATISSNNERAMIILAKFLDPTYDDLNLKERSNVNINLLSTP